MTARYVGKADNELFVVPAIGAVTLYTGATWPIARRPYTDEMIGEFGTVNDAAEAVRDDARQRERDHGKTVAQIIEVRS